MLIPYHDHNCVQNLVSDILTVVSSLHRKEGMNREVFRRHHWKQRGSFREIIMVTLGHREIWQWLTSSDTNAGRINQSCKGPTNYDYVAVVFWDSFQLFVTTNEKEEGSIVVRRHHRTN